MIISVDAGKFATKAVAENGSRTSFRTKSTPITKTLDIEAAGNSNKVTFGDKTFIIGDQGEEIDYSLEKNTLLHKMAIYLAAYRLKALGQVNAVVGCPLTIFRDDSNRKEFKENIKEVPGTLAIDGEEMHVRFNRVLIMPESSGVVYIHEQLFRNKRVAVIDLGGLNMNFCIYNNLIPQLSTMITTNQGSMDIQSRVKKVMEAEYKKTLSTSDIEEILKQGGLKYQGKIEPKSQLMLEEIYNDYVREVVNGIKKDVALDMLDVVVTGGTSLLVDSIIPKYIPHVQVVDDTQWTNANGFLKLAKVKFNG